MSANYVCYLGGIAVQAIAKGREPWFLVEDLGRLLEIRNLRQRMKEVPEEEKSLCYATFSEGRFKEQRRRMRVVNEAGLYRLIMMSRTEAAEKFKTWVVREVLPAIRRTGKYEDRKRLDMCLMPKGMSKREAFQIAVGQRFRALEWIKEDRKLEQTAS